EYVAREAKDFILFKTRLLLEDTKGDPIKKSSLVKDIVASIARIPDPIKRSVYQKECASLLDVAEPALVEETNKLITQSLKKQEERKARAPEAASDSPDAQPNPEVPVEDPAFVRPREKNMARGDEYQERDIIRLLVQFGCQTLPEGISVAEYILADIEDSLGNFDNPLYGKIATECHDLMFQGRTPDVEFFLQHDNPAVRELAVDLMSSAWELSPNWEERYNYPLQNQKPPEENFDLDARKAVDLFKIRKIEKMIQVMKTRIQAAEKEQDDELWTRYMKIMMKLNETLAEIGRKSGMVVRPK
ncbi:MAG: hypothetical protein JNL02_02240, partial [Saprospiraceae bacterium]|nr:hypothetical protein [Saprospiraceae bacterium]